MVPEDHLLAALSPLWRKRFVAALRFMDQHIHQSSFPTWDEVAKAAAVSPYHFHRMFRAVFSEPPAQYLRRHRLRIVLDSLVDHPELSVTTIAHQAGFSSSQALAKALKRDLGCSAQEIRRLREKGGLEKIEKLFLKLGHPGEGEESVEQKLAEQLSFTLHNYPKRYIQVIEADLKTSEEVIDIAYELSRKHKVDLAWYFRLSDYQKPLAEQSVSVGYYLEEEKEGCLIVPDGSYLEVRCAFSSETGYIAAWDALYRKALEADAELPEDSYCTETIHGPIKLLDTSLQMSLGLQVI